MRKLLAIPLLVVPAVSFAAVPAGTDVAFTAILTDATTLAGYAAPIVLGVLGLVIIFKLIKRFANKV